MFGVVILLVSFVLLMVSWINWGFGLVVGVLFVKVLVCKVWVDYWLLVVLVYLGFIVWYGGLVGLVLLVIVMVGYLFEGVIGVILIDCMIFVVYNLFIVIVLFIVVLLVNCMMMLWFGEEVFVDFEKLVEFELIDIVVIILVEWMENSCVFSWLIGVVGLVYLF